MQTKRWYALAGAILAITLALVIGACGGDGDGGDGGGDGTEPATQTTIVDVPHGEWEMNPSAESAPAGTIIFNAINTGVIPHNFRAAKTDLSPDALPIDAGMQAVDEEQLNIVASTDEDLDAGESVQVSVDLEPGSYVFFCNVPGHYQAGLYAAFTVE